MPITPTVLRPTVILAASSTGKRAAAAAASSTSACGSSSSSSTNKPASPVCSAPLINNLSGEHRRHFSSVGSGAQQQRLYRQINNNNTFRSNAGNSSAPQASSSTTNTAHRRAFSSSSKRDFYDVLDVGRGSDKGEIKKAYFKLAKKYHPDTNKDDKTAADKFKEATEAYEVLSDDKQRQLYDSYGHAGVDPNAGFGGGPGGGGNPFEGFGGFSGFSGGDGSFHYSSSGQEIDPEELFEAFFGGGARRRNRGPRKGSDLQMHVRLTFEEAVKGAKKDLHLRYQIHNKKKNKMEVKERDVEVDVPAGIDNGMNLRLTGQGAEGDPGAPRGNLIVQVLVDDDNYFHRDGVDVHTECPISMTQAVLGGTVDVRTLTGTVEMKVPKGTQVDSKLMLRGKGIPHLHSEGRKGNHIVHLQIEIPKKVSKRQEELLREFDEEMKHSGGGIYGRLAKAAGSAFETIFGHGDDKKTDKKTDKEKSNEQDKGDDSDDDVEEKKQQTA
eukprot:CAMPEP_0113411034 /NCGR_PEP_ID=MMETSP0013_2-20120614/22028_1 /TAXON_ID=2843 ORGANISM="Skeletonema costatum, Strain 1716" /NCGR_SAMPLE_ID=MMETSP0013_2 /ASSEMBLY_ACC=CAM_ASM_000158 /LENGTH=496 /DNA_ID=CAMNT_0000297317 /DNA_START=39 /DNA_END=1529 /DNA_ORIENTATION=+ /assembly_acc=CAM_ASM_000158